MPFKNSKQNTADYENIIKLIFKPCGLALSCFKAELESQEYYASNFQINGLKVKFRKAKITPTKTGQFVTIWKRNKNGITEPFDFKDDFDFVLIYLISENKSGIMFFPKGTLADKGIIKYNEIKGKCGIRVYAPWDKTMSKQAQLTQLWQAKHFIDLSTSNKIDFVKMKSLFKLNIKLSNKNKI